MIGVIGDYDPTNRTHTALDQSLAAAGAEAAWIATDEVPPGDVLSHGCSGLWIAPKSPYRSMEGARRAIATAREHGIPLVAT